MRRIVATARSRRVGRGALSSAIWLALCALASAPSASASTAPRVSSAIRVPLTTSTTTSTTSWAVVTMGENDAQHDLFPELFGFDARAKKWRLATPPGVADNGGLFIAPGGGVSLLVGFGTSQALAFSPLALSVDGGRKWLPGGLEEPLEAVPSSVALGASSSALALVKSTGQTRVLREGSSLTSWSSLLSGNMISALASSCTISAIGIGPSNVAIIGTSCTKAGTIGLFRAFDGHLSAIAMHLPQSLARGSVQVLSIEHSGGSIAALLAVRSVSQTVLMVAYPDAQQSWQLSRPLPLPSGATIASTGGGVGRSAFVLLRTSRGAVAATNAGPNLAWQMLDSLPSATASIAIEPSGLVDALVVDASTLTIWHEALPGARFEKAQRIVVPIQYGSSS